MKLKLNDGINLDIVLPDEVTVIEWRDFATKIENVINNFSNKTVMPSTVQRAKRKKYDRCNWNYDQLEQLRKLAEEGLSQKEIAKKMGLKLKQIEYKMAATGISRKSASAVKANQRFKWSPEHIKKLKAFVGSGLNYAEIAKHLGVTQIQVYQKIRQLKLEITQPTKLKQFQW